MRIYKPSASSVEAFTRMAAEQIERRNRARDHAPSDKDSQRERLAGDVAAFLARGGRITESRPMVTVPGKLPARTAERSW